MRPVVYSVAASLDGFIAGPDGEFDWIPDDPEVDWRAFLARFDTLLVGRRTWELTRDPGSSAKLPALRTHVFGSTLDPAEHPGVTVVREDAGRVVETLRREDGREIWLMGGGVLFRSLLEAGQVDVVEVALVPILLGAGLPLLPPAARRTRLELASAEPHASGIVMLRYDVVGAA